MGAMFVCFSLLLCEAHTLIMSNLTWPDTNHSYARLAYASVDNWQFLDGFGLHIRRFGILDQDWICS